MTRIKACSSLLVAIALIAASAGVVQAGGGAGTSPGGDIPLLQCYTVEESTSSRYVLTLTDQFGTQEKVRLGKSRLLCTPVTVVVERGPTLTEFDFNDPVTGGHLSCYGLRSKHDDDERGARVKVTDPFGVQTVDLEKERLLCSGATKEVVPRNFRD